jgi:gas vesicle protein
MISKGTALGFLTGAAVGGVVALLYAPQKGEHLRADIKRRASIAADDVGQYFRDVASKTSGAVKKAFKNNVKVA